MTDLFVKKFIKNYTDTTSSTVRTAYGKFSSIVGIICNVLLFTGKIIIGLITASVSITADAVNNLSDASSSIVSLFGFKLASRPADKEHPYGHGRYEYLSGLTVAVLIVAIGIELFRSSLDRVINPADVEFSILSIIILAICLLVKLWMMFFYKKIGKLINSQTLFATAQDSRNDVITTGAVILAALISHFTGLQLDGYMGVAVALFIIYSGFGLVRSTLDPLLGKAPDKEFVKEIKDKILSYPGVLGTHDLMVHDYGPGRQFASVHVEMAAENDVIKNHDIIDKIEFDFLEEQDIHMLVHFDPIITKDEALIDLHRWLNKKIKTINSDLSIHDIRIVPYNDHSNVFFDCVVPLDISISDDELKGRVEQLVVDHYPNYTCQITLDKSYDALPHNP